jgi:hypothetical protein
VANKDQSPDDVEIKKKAKHTQRSDEPTADDSMRKADVANGENPDE